MKRYWKIAVLANIKDDNQPKPEGVPPDAFADFDHIETVDALRAALETDGHTTVFIQADRELPYALREVKPDICFNIAEGLGGDAREAQVPALLEMLNIPYTGSRVLTNGISLDKTLTKRIWRDRRLPVAPFQEFNAADEPLRPELKFPLFVKPAREGTGMGVDMKAIVNNEKELRERAQYIINIYQQPALVETFLPGREFTVGIWGALMRRNIHDTLNGMKRTGFTASLSSNWTPLAPMNPGSIPMKQNPKMSAQMVLPATSAPPISNPNWKKN
jgi:D-alanine-D-alanine ligase